MSRVQAGVQGAVSFSSFVWHLVQDFTVLGQLMLMVAGHAIAEWRRHMGRQALVTGAAH